MDNSNVANKNKVEVKEKLVEKFNQSGTIENDFEFDSVPKHNTEVYDDGDIASALEMDFIAKALENHKKNNLPETHPDFDGESCIDCGIEIVKARLQMGKIRCVDCQEQLEKMNKRFGR